MVFLLVPIGYLYFTGDRSWLVGGLALAWMFAAMVMGLFYGSHMHASMSRLHSMKAPEATVEVLDDVLRFTSDVGKSEVVWRAVREIWCLPRLWLVMFSPSQFVTLPAADLT